jgi:hypothetical protein
MPFRPPPAVLISVVALALALVPGSLSAPSAGTDAMNDLARAYVGKNAADLGVTSADVTDLVVTSSYRSSHSGVTHVNLNQLHRDLEVFGGHVTVSIADNGTVVFAGGSLAALRGGGSGSADLDPIKAVEAAAEGLDLEEPKDLQVLSSSGGPAQETVLSGGGISDEPIPAELGWQPTSGGLRLAWQLVIDDSSDVSLWKAIVDAENGRLLAADDWTSHDSIDTLAATLSRETAAAPRQSASTGSSSATSGVADGSSYSVFAFPKESPNDGGRTVVANPAHDFASPFGWHDTNGVAGAEFTTTQGNNVHAYLDQDNNNSADFGGSPDGGGSLTFDFPADLSEHAQNYRSAVVTNLFYANNALHDVLHGYGFDEPSGNFQANNYGRGGGGGDYVRAEAADGGGTNNANFSTPAADSGTPRMQMYLWPGNQFGAQNQVVVNGTAYNASWARFSPAPTVAGTTGAIFDAGTGCTAADYAGAPAGDWIAIVTGSNLGCQNIEKARQAGTAGAKAVIVSLNAAGAAPILTGSMTAAPPTIPVASITRDDGVAIRAQLPADGTVRKHPDHPGIRDGDFENGIIIHEYGHGVSNRLTGGPGINCLSGNEQAGEGWSDYLAISVLLDPELDDPDEPRGMGPYALFQADRHGAGIRPRPYTRDMSLQPFTYDSIKTGGWLNGTSLALPHGLGHGWAAVLWDMTWDLIDKHGFNPDVYADWNTGGNNRSIQYVIDGLKLQGCGPGLVVARGAIIAAADELSNGEDTCTLWASFARRGLGFSAVQGTTNRDDNAEAFDTHPECQEGFFGSVADEPSLNVAKPGSNQPMVFSLGGDHGLDILASGAPYSRMVDCNTLKTVDPASPFITPRPIPVPAETAGNSGLTYDPTQDRYTYPWKTDKAWDGTCREFVLTRTDGVQHRAYFRFATDPSFPVSGNVRNASGQPVENATVTLAGTQSPLTATTDASGFYSFASVLKGTYTATATGSACDGQHEQQVVVSGPTSADFALPAKTDSFGYSCRTETLAFTQAADVVPITGDDVSGVVTLPFDVTLYGSTYTQARICTNGFVELVGPATASCSFGNTAIPATGRPNPAVYGFWDDLFVDADASIRIDVLGTAPNRRFVVEWRNIRFFGDTTRRIDVNVVFYENGQILTQHRNIADDGRERGNSATLGIENETGTVALQYSRNEAVLEVEPAVTSIRYLPPA